MIDIRKPSLFGIKHSNRDFSDKDAWGKNQFNSSFPAALSAYLAHRNFENVYIKLNENLETYHDRISTEQLYGLPSDSENIFYSFESQFLPFQKFLIGNIPRTDLVTQNYTDGAILKGLEIKLTALPDNSTYNLRKEKFDSHTRGPVMYLGPNIKTKDRHIFYDPITIEMCHSFVFILDPRYIIGPLE